MNTREDYLSAIYSLTEGGDQKTTTSEVSEELDISDASASDTIQKLEEDNLVCRAPYKGFTLSPAGKNRGKKAKEKFEELKDIFEELGVNNPVKEAKKVESSMSEEVMEKLREEIIGGN